LKAKKPDQIKKIIRLIDFSFYMNGSYWAILLKWIEENPDHGANTLNIKLICEL